MKISFLVLAGFLMVQVLFAQVEPKQELRGVWLTTVGRADWPISYNEAGQKAEMIQMFDELKAAGINAVLFQVRPECDALYQSAYEPWSRYLMGTQGEDPGYDPLQFAIEEAHKRGMELHAWMNPYRINASTSDGGNYYHSTHVYMEHPEWAMVYSSNKKILNPGRPEVMTYIGDVVEDLVSSYPVDGVHFDDYFYAYGGTPASLDETEYAAYGASMSLDDWRRDNVNRMVDTVYARIQETNPNVRFGISPFGTYRNGVPPGIISMDAYAQIYCDPLAWLEDGTVDYLTPQTYWPTGGAQDFETLVYWWEDQCSIYGRHLYTGHGVYKYFEKRKRYIPWEEDLHENKSYIDEMLEEAIEKNLSVTEIIATKGTSDPVASWTHDQVGTQIDIVRAAGNKYAMGGVYFRVAHFLGWPGLTDYLAANKYTHPAIIPEMIWKTLPAPSAPDNLRTEVVGSEYALVWDHVPTGNERFAIYSSENGSLSAEDIVAVPENLQAVCFENHISLASMVVGENSNIVVTTVAPTGKEGVPSSKYILEGVPFVKLKSPDDGVIIADNQLLEWGSAGDGAEYLLQISSTASFSALAYESGWLVDSSFSVGAADLEGEQDYYWRVRAKESLEGPFSSPRKFTAGYPAIPGLTKPAHLAQNMSTTPVIRWDVSAATENVYIVISTNSAFTAIVAEETMSADAGEGSLTTELQKDTQYYIKIKGINTYGESPYSSYNTFSTTAGEIPNVSIVAPDDNATVASFDKLKWETSTTMGTISYSVDIALDEDFLTGHVNSDWINSTEVSLAETKLEGGRTYYWRVKAKSEYGESEFTDVRSFIAGFPSRPVITQPLHLSSGNVRNLLIGWEASEDTDEIITEFASYSNFISIVYSESFTAAGGLGRISEPLEANKGYYLRIKASNEYGTGLYSNTRYFGVGSELSARVLKGENTDIEIFPNPLIESELIIRSANGQTEISKLKVYTVSGRLMLEMETGDTEIRIGRGRFPAKGFYIIELDTNKGRVIQSLIAQ